MRLAELARRSYRDGCWVVPLADLTGARPAEAYCGRGTGPAGHRPAVGCRDARRLHRPPHRAAGARQLRARRGRRRRPRGGAPRDLPERQVPAHQPPAAQAQRRGRHRSPTAEPPRRGDVATPEAITHYEAVNLFVDRATSARSDFRADTGQRGSRRHACAATWTASRSPSSWLLPGSGRMSPQEIRDSLAERLEVLNLGYRDADERHQSLRACVEWSYDFCSELEQRFWARSSVFSGRIRPGVCSRPSVWPTTCPPARSSI